MVIHTTYAEHPPERIASAQALPAEESTASCPEARGTGGVRIRWPDGTITTDTWGYQITVGLPGDIVEPMTGIEPAYSAWEADVLPLNYIGFVDHEG